MNDGSVHRRHKDQVKILHHETNFQVKEVNQTVNLKPLKETSIHNDTSIEIPDVSTLVSEDDFNISKLEKNSSTPNKTKLIKTSEAQDNERVKRIRKPPERLCYEVKGGRKL